MRGPLLQCPSASGSPTLQRPQVKWLPCKNTKRGLLSGRGSGQYTRAHTSVKRPAMMSGSITASNLYSATAVAFGPVPDASGGGSRYAAAEPANATMPRTAIQNVVGRKKRINTLRAMATLLVRRSWRLLAQGEMATMGN